MKESVSLALHCHTGERLLSPGLGGRGERTVGPGTAGTKPWEIPWGQQGSRGVYLGKRATGSLVKKFCAASMGRKQQRPPDHGPRWTWIVGVSLPL